MNLNAPTPSRASSDVDVPLGSSCVLTDFAFGNDFLLDPEGALSPETSMSVASEPVGLEEARLTSILLQMGGMIYGRKTTI